VPASGDGALCAKAFKPERDVAPNRRPSASSAAGEPENAHASSTEEYHAYNGGQNNGGTKNVENVKSETQLNLLKGRRMLDINQPA
jgi:hypothetical protein